jgi:hypothetical protein
MAAPTFRASNTNSSAGTTTLTLDKPSLTAQYDIMRIWVYWESNSAITVTVTGFAEVTGESADNTSTNPDFHVRSYWKRAGASEGTSYDVTFSSSVACLGIIASYPGAVQTVTPIEDSDKTTGGGNVTLPSIDTLTADTLVIGVVFSFNWDNTWSSAVMTERLDTGGMALYDVTQAAAGASGTKAITQSASESYIGCISNLASTEYVPPAGGVPKLQDHYHRMRQA